jgi:multisubunit Na+/H+ antiporter MnhE subunit
MISYRGIFAFVVGAWFLWFASNPEALGDEGLPLILRGVLILAGLGLVAVGIVLSRFVYGRYRLLQSTEPTPAEVTIRVHEDSDSTTYSLEVRLEDGAWAISAVGDKAVTLHEKDVPHAAQVWRDPKSGAPVAVAINGKHINTLPAPRRM